MRDSQKPSSSAGHPLAGAALGYSCAICGTKVAALPAPSAAAEPDAAAAKLAASHRYRPFCSARCQRIDLGNWLQELYVVPGAPAPTDGGEAAAERDRES
jgi:endogenous inhibitor of DNA gyrase (YacG/DUF329 family)